MKTMTEWGLANAHQERFAFGKGWSLVRFNANMIEPQVQPLIGFPRAWSRGTNGPVTADVVRVQIATEADFAKYQGKLKGKIVLMQPARPVRMLEGPVVLRMGDKDFAEALTTPVPAGRGGPAGSGRSGGGRGAGGRRGAAPDSRSSSTPKASSRSSIAAATATWRRAAATSRGRRSAPTAARSSRAAASARDNTAGSTRARRHARRRALQPDGPRARQEPAGEGRAERRRRSSTTRRRRTASTPIAEIPGTDLASEIVLLGAHFDSHPYATGATDNATGSAAMMEALRILKAVGAQPRRTIRIALWGGEEQGLLGSRAYVREHFADVDTMALKPEHAKLSAYFNSDNGTGRVRGIWLQGNLAVRPIFEQWMAPLRDLGVTTLGPRSVASTDHSSFDDAGIPAFQFMVDRLEYNSRTHHSNMDVFDRVQRDDMVQQATVVAVLRLQRGDAGREAAAQGASGPARPWHEP